MYGNINELSDASACLWKSYLFFLTSIATLKLDYPEIRLYSWKSTLLSEVSGAFAMVLERLSESIPRQVVPTTASGLQGEQPLAN